MEWLPGKWLEISPISPALRLVWIGTSTVEAPTTASIAGPYSKEYLDLPAIWSFPLYRFTQISAGNVNSMVSPLCQTRFMVE